MGGEAILIVDNPLFLSYIRFVSYKSSRFHRRSRILLKVEKMTHLVDLNHAQAYDTFQKANTVLGRINGGFQKFIAAREDGKFVAVVMFMPTEFTPDLIAHITREGAHVMVGLADVRETPQARVQTRFQPADSKDKRDVMARLRAEVRDILQYRPNMPVDTLSDQLFVRGVKPHRGERFSPMVLEMIVKEILKA